MSSSDSSGSITELIAEEIAAREGVEPIELSPPIGAVVDADALNEFYDEEPSIDVQTVIEYKGYSITIKGPEQVEIENL